MFDLHPEAPMLTISIRGLWIRNNQIIKKFRNFFISEQSFSSCHVRNGNSRYQWNALSARAELGQDIDGIVIVNQYDVTSRRWINGTIKQVDKYDVA